MDWLPYHQLVVYDRASPLITGPLLVLNTIIRSRAKVSGGGARGRSVGEKSKSIMFSFTDMMERNGTEKNKRVINDVE